MTNDEGIEGKGGQLLVDTKKCQGCMTCMLVCSLVHEGKENLSMSRIQVIQSSFEKYPRDIEIRCVESCDLCLDTPFWDEQGGGRGKTGVCRGLSFRSRAIIHRDFNEY